MDPNQREPIVYGGAVCSSVGYLLMLITAVTFKEWRRSTTNQVWLFMCGSFLLHILALTLYTLHYCRRVEISWLDNDVGFALFWVINDYFMIVKSNWLLVGAWLAFKKIASDLADASRSLGLLKPSLFACLTPVPFCVARSLVWKPEKCLDMALRIPIMYRVMFLTMNAFGVYMYSCVLKAVYRSNNYRRQSNLLGTSLMAATFIFTSGLQFLIALILNVVNEKTFQQAHLVLAQIVDAIVMFNVFVYSIIFVVGVKGTRQLWLMLCARKMDCLRELTPEPILELQKI